MASINDGDPVDKLQFLLCVLNEFEEHNGFEAILDNIALAGAGSDVFGDAGDASFQFLVRI